MYWRWNRIPELADLPYDGSVRLFDLASGSQLAKFQGHVGAVLCVAFSDDGKLAASGSADHRVCVWRLLSGDKATHAATSN